LHGSLSSLKMTGSMGAIIWRNTVGVCLVVQPTLPVQHIAPSWHSGLLARPSWKPLLHRWHELSGQISCTDAFHRPFGRCNKLLLRSCNLKSTQAVDLSLFWDQFITKSCYFSTQT
jgi:hypothetical protein